MTLVQLIQLLLCLQILSCQSWSTYTVDLFNNNVPFSGWISNYDGSPMAQQYQCPEQPHEIFLGLIDYTQNIFKKTYTNIPPHFQIRLVMEANIVWDWYDDIIVITGDSTTIFSGTYNYQTYKSTTYCEVANRFEFVFIDQTITHTSTSLVLKMETTFTSYTILYKRLAIRNIILYIQQCHESCLTCTNELACVTCPPNSTKGTLLCQCNVGYYLYAYQCIATCPGGYTQDSTSRKCIKNCPLNCDICSTTIQCTTCSSGYYLLLGQCVTKCPSHSIQSGTVCNDHSSLYQQSTYLFKGFHDIDGYISTSTINSLFTFSGGVTNSFVAGQKFRIYNDQFMLGGIGVWNKGTIQTVFTSLPAHFQIRLYAKSYFIDFSTVPQQYKISIDSTDMIITMPVGTNTIGISPYSDMIIPHSIIQAHIATTLTIKFIVSQSVFTDPYRASFGITDLFVLIDKCSNNCNACTSDTTCTTCTTSYGLFQNACYICDGTTNRNTNCQCITNYYVDATVFPCQQCKLYCNECSSSSTQCIACSSISLRLNAPLCDQCPIQKYIKSGFDICQPCHISCRTCNGDNITDCQTCYTNYYKQPTSTLCLTNCPSGYYKNSNDSTNPICTQCQPPCATCDNSAQFCISCTTGNLYNNQCISTCPPHQFISNSICTPCDSNCSECTTTSTTCIQCYSNKQLYNNQCLDQCPATYYPFNATCNQCGIGCEVCTISSCSYCLTSYYMSTDSKCSNQCNPGYYGNILTRTCNNCHQSCLTCGNADKSGCLSCAIPLVHQIINAPLGRCGIMCQLGYYKVNDTCSRCDIACESCNNQSCLQCANGYYRNLDDQCRTTCDSKYYIDVVLHVCSKCDITCLNCYGALNTQCNACAIPLNLFMGQCITICPNNYVALLNVCQACAVGCKVCSGTGINQCSQCTIGIYLLINQCLQQCPDYYYPQRSTFICEQCTQSNCIKCNYKDCLICQNGYNLFNNQCLSTCPQSYYADIGICRQCNSTCQSCTTIDNCTTCVTGLLLNTGQCIPQCPSNKYTDGIQCQPCDSGCLKCNGPTNAHCTDCTTYLHQSQCTSICPTGYYQLLSQRKCDKCDVKCATCFGPTEYQCLTCINLFYLFGCVDTCPIGSHLNGSSCEPNIPINISQCSYQCQTCALVPINCLTCTANRVHTLPTCGCAQGYFDDGTALCKPCDNKCSLCAVSAINCVQCNGNRLMPNCQCALGFYDDGLSLNCPKCPIQCKSCTNGICDTCLNNRSGQQCTCSNGYYEAYEPYCQPCQYKCQDCIDFNDQCTKCSGIRELPPLCQCPLGYYDNVTECSKCDNTCYSCNQQGCLICAANRIGPLNGVCQCQSNAVSRLNVGSAYCTDCTYAVSSAVFTDALDQIVISLGIQVQYQLNITCQHIFKQITLLKLGKIPQCIINNNIIIQLGQDSTIMPGDSIELNTVLIGTDCINPFQQIRSSILTSTNAPINTLLPKVIFKEIIDTSLCVVINLQFNKQLYDGMRQFKVNEWIQELPIDTNPNIQQQLNNINKQIPIPDIFMIPPQILNSFTRYRYSVSITNFIGLTNKQSIEFITKSTETVVLSFDQQSISTNRYTEWSSYVNIQYYNCNQNIPIKPIIIEYQWYLNDIMTNSSSITGTQYHFSQMISYQFAAYQLLIGEHQLKVIAMINNHTISQSVQIIKVLMAPLKLQIVGGNRQVGFTQSFNLVAQVIDVNQPPTFQSNTTYNYNWSCMTVNKQPCLNQDMIPLTFNSSDTQMIKQKTLTPYYSYIFQTVVESSIVSVTMQVVEIDIPTLNVTTPNVLMLNYYDEQLLQFRYDNVNPDALMYAGAIIYDQDVQTTFQFHYLDYKFTLWHYFNNLTRTQGQTITLRASIYNPRYIMPSIVQITFQYNHPPSNCSVILTPVDMILEFHTPVTISVIGCYDEHTPFTYRYIIYSSNQALQQDIHNSTNLNYMLLKNYQYNNNLTTLLPFSKSIQIIGISIQDSYGGITNITTPVNVINNNITQHDLQQFLDSRRELDERIYALAMVTQRLQYMTGIENYKVEIFRQLQQLSNQSLPIVLKDLVYSSINILLTMDDMVSVWTDQDTIIQQISQDIILSDSNAKQYNQLQYSNMLNSIGNQNSEMNLRQFYRSASILASLIQTNLISESSNSKVESNIQDITNRLYLLGIPNQVPFDIQSKQIRMDIRTATEKTINEITGYVLQQPILNRILIEDSNHTNYYKYSNIRYKSNPYYSDSNFPKNSSGYELVDIHILDNNTLQAIPIKQNISIGIPLIKQNQTVACINKVNEQWSADVCKTQLIDQIITCVCETISPTTVMNSIEDILDTGTDLFTQDALDSIASFSFYYTAVFYLYIVQTMGYIMAVIWGYQQDIIQKPEDSIVLKSDPEDNHKVHPIRLQVITEEDVEPSIQQFSRGQPRSQRIQITSTRKNSTPEELGSPRNGTTKLLEQCLFYKVHHNAVNIMTAYLLYIKNFHQILSIFWKFDKIKSRPMRATILYTSILGTFAVMFTFAKNSTLVFTIALSFITAPINKIYQLILEKTLGSQARNTKIIGVVFMISTSALSSYAMMAALAVMNSIELANEWTVNYLIAFSLDNLLYCQVQLFIQFSLHIKLVNIAFLQKLAEKLLDDQAKEFLYGE